MNVQQLIKRTLRTAAPRQNRQRGFVQGLAIVLVVLAVIGVGIIMISINYLNKSKVQNEVQFITDLMTNTKAYGSQVSAFDATNSTLSALIGRGFFPPAQVAGAVVTNQWRGLLTVAPAQINTLGDSLAFTTANVPEAACKQIATALDQVAAKITVNATVTKAVGAATTVATVDTSCTGTNNIIVYTLAS